VNFPDCKTIENSTVQSHLEKFALGFTFLVSFDQKQSTH